MPNAMWMGTGPGASVGTATLTAAGDLVTLTSHGLVDGQIIVCNNLTGGAGSSIVVEAPYWVANATADDFQIRASAGGPVLDIASDGGMDVYQADAAYTHADLRRSSSALMWPADSGVGARSGFRPGVSDRVTVSGSTVTVAPCSGTLQGRAPTWADTDGPYQWHTLSTELALTSADPSDDRIDTVVVRVEDDAIDGLGRLRATVDIVDGTAGSGSPPSLDDGEEALADITVPGGGGTAVVAERTDNRTVALGGILPVGTESELPAAALYAGMMAYVEAWDAVVVSDGTDWTVLAATATPVLLTFTSADDFVIGDYPWARWVRVRTQAAGAAGGGTNSTGSGQTAAGSGGGAGAYSESIIAASALPSSVTVTPGTGGTGADGTDGGSGGSASFGSLVVALGGSGGTAGTVSSNFTRERGGLGGDAGGGTGDLTIDGGNGYMGYSYGGSGIHIPGEGGTPHLGRGGRPPGTAGDGLQGGEYGGGGSGGSRGESGSATRGGPGNDGIVIVEVH